MFFPPNKSVYFVEVIPTNLSTSDTYPALQRMINRIQNLHKCKAVYRLHADRAHELSGTRVRGLLESMGVAVTSTAGYDSNANGRAERAIRWIKDEVKTFLVSNIHSEKFQEKIQSLWTFAAQHAAEVHCRQAFGLPPC